MTNDDPTPFDNDTLTEDDFESILEQLLVSAFDNGIDPRGSWEYRNGDSHPDFEVMVTELMKDSGND